MNVRVRLIALAALVVGLVAGGGASASAWDGAPARHGEPATVAAAVEDAPVTGELWSSPAVPVTCNRSGDTVHCTPDNSDDTVERACYFGVPSSSGPLTVCSIASANQSVLDAAGKKLDYQWGCQLGDVPCAFMEGTAETLSAEAINFGSRAQSALSFNTNTHLWTTAVTEWSFWAWAVLIVVLGAGIVAITMAAFEGGGSGALQVFLRFFLTVPLTQFSLWLVGTLLNSIDLLVKEIFATSDVFGTLQAMLFGGGSVAPLSGVLNTGIVFVATGLMYLVMMVRNIGLAGLILVMPLAWMLFPVRSIGKQWVIRYAAAVVSLLLASPIMMSLFRFLTEGLRSVSSIWDPAIWPYMLGMIVICFAPFAVFTLFSFAGSSAIDAAASGAGRSAAGAAGRVTRAVPRPRVGVPPAGMGPRGGGSGGGGRGPGGGVGVPKGPSAPAGSPRSASPGSSPATGARPPAGGGGPSPVRTPSQAAAPAPAPAPGGGGVTPPPRPSTAGPVSGPASPSGVRR